jgi:hypothetical protein
MSKQAMTVLAVVLAAVLILGATGTIAYRAGLAQGLSQTGAVPAHSWSHWGHGHHWHPPFGFVFPALVLILGFVLLRHALWGGRCWGGRGGNGYWSGYGPWGREVPPGFAEWHRRAHESMEGPKEGPRPDSAPGSGPTRVSG